MSYAYALEGLISFSLLAAVIYGPWQWVCTDAARQSLFHLRDQLFDLARAGRLEFSSPEYLAIRDAFDLQIRFAHALSLLRLLVFARVVHQVTPKPNAARAAIAQIADVNTRAEVSKLVDDLDQTMVILMVAKSPILLLIALVMAATVIPGQAFRKILKGSQFNILRMAKEAIQRFIGFPTERFFAPLIHEEAAAFKS